MTQKTKTNPTPGPWRVGEMSGGCINIEADTTPRHITVARVHIFDTTQEAAANARLIAHAPMLRGLVDTLAQQGSEPDSLCHRGLVPQAECSRCKPILEARAVIAAIDGGSQ